jgi:hypothetical protein
MGDEAHVPPSVTADTPLGKIGDAPPDAGVSVPPRQ